VSILERLSFDGLRGDAGRSWFRCSDLIEASAAAGLRLTRYEVQKAVAGLPKPEKRYGHNRYREIHMEAVLEAVRRSKRGE
jgi:hypothetical protein